MKRTLLLCLAVALCSVMIPAKVRAKSADFSGNWVLDASQTKNLPEGVESYAMAVKQDSQQLKVQTTLQRGAQSADSSNGPYPSGGQGPVGGGGYPTGSPGTYPGGRGRGGLGMPGGVGVGWPGGGVEGPLGGGWPGGGIPGGGGSRRPPQESRSRGNMTPFMLFPKTAVFNLDGSTSTAQLGGPTSSDATLKADWAKSGKMLKLSLVGDAGAGQKSGETQLKDQWELSEDGRFLKVERAVHPPHGSSTVHLVFRKQAADATSSPAQGQQN